MSLNLFLTMIGMVFGVIWWFDTLLGKGTSKRLGKVGKFLWRCGSFVGLIAFLNLFVMVYSGEFESNTNKNLKTSNIIIDGLQNELHRVNVVLLQIKPAISNLKIPVGSSEIMIPEDTKINMDPKTGEVKIIHLPESFIKSILKVSFKYQGPESSGDGVSAAQQLKEDNEKIKKSILSKLEPK